MNRKNFPKPNTQVVSYKKALSIVFNKTRMLGVSCSEQ